MLRAMTNPRLNPTVLLIGVNLHGVVERLMSQPVKADGAEPSLPPSGLLQVNGIFEWVAPIATMVAAMMTAANLGARMTGWGFVVFTAGSIAWTLIGITSGQTNLIVSNGFLAVVNCVGIWRWLGRQTAYEDGGKSAERASRRADTPTLFTATGIAGLPVQTLGGAPLGKAVEALIECASGRVSYVVVASGGVGGVDECLRPVPRDLITFHSDRLAVRLGAEQFARLPKLGTGAWPSDGGMPARTAA